jgi:hypothetical protein
LPCHTLFNLFPADLLQFLQTMTEVFQLVFCTRLSIIEDRNLQLGSGLLDPNYTLVQSSDLDCCLLGSVRDLARFGQMMVLISQFLAVMSVLHTILLIW